MTYRKYKKNKEQADKARERLNELIACGKVEITRRDIKSNRFFFQCRHYGEYGSGDEGFCDYGFRDYHTEECAVGNWDICELHIHCGDPSFNVETGSVTIAFCLCIADYFNNYVNVPVECFSDDALEYLTILCKDAVTTYAHGEQEDYKKHQDIPQSSYCLFDPMTSNIDLLQVTYDDEIGLRFSDLLEFEHIASMNIMDRFG